MKRLIWRRNKTRKGQSTLEYIMMIGVIAAAIVGIASQVISEGTFKKALDGLLKTGVEKATQTVDSAEIKGQGQ